MRVNVNANGHVYGQVSVEDPADVEKSALYHEPYNLNMYSAQGGGKVQQSKELHQRHPSSPDYTGESINSYTVN
jgi:discoidin domain receptor family protein 2